METPAVQRTNTRTIASNSFWSGLEQVCSVAAAFATSIPAARVIGPERLGYYNYIQWLTNLSGMVGLLGVPGATRKYMAEYLGAGKPDIARAVFRATLKLQILTATVVTSVGLAVALWTVPLEYRWIAFFLVLSLWPSMVASIPSQANVAGERMAFNTIGSLASYVVSVSAVTISLLMHWDLLGIAVGVTAFRAVDCGIRLFLVHRWLGVAAVVPLPAELRHKVISFSGYNLVLMMLQMIVWDRSDMLFLRHYVKDTSEIAFFSVAMGIVEKIQTIPFAFGSAAFATIQAQFGRDRRELPKLTSTALWYSLACSAPLSLGLAAVSRQLVPFLYGAKYTAAVPVLALAAVFAVPKALLSPLWSVMEAESRQRFMVKWLIICAIANIGLDILLIPHLGAVGAAIANGVAQLVLTVGLLWRVHSLFQLNFRVVQTLKLFLSTGLMCGAVLAISNSVVAWWILPAQVLLGSAVFGLCIRFTGALQPDDRHRLLALTAVLPAALRAPFARVTLFLAPQTLAESLGA